VSRRLVPSRGETELSMMLLGLRQRNEIAPHVAISGAIQITRRGAAARRQEKSSREIPWPHYGDRLRKFRRGNGMEAPASNVAGARPLPPRRRRHVRSTAAAATAAADATARGVLAAHW
jgi:hypothetical protein